MERIQELTSKKEMKEAEKLIEQMQKEMEPFNGERSKLYQERNKFVNERHTGHVWVFLQQDAPDPAPTKQQTVSATSESH